LNLRFRVLGPLEVVVGGDVVPVGGPRAGAILSLLVLEAGGVVSRDRLVDEVWGDDPPATAVTALQVHVSSLRKLVGDALRSRAAGYSLDISPGQVDSAGFESLLREAGDTEDVAARARLLRAALALWRGEAFTGVPRIPTVGAAVARLSELRTRAIEDRVDADLALGRHLELTAELRELSIANPCRERLAGQLMLALHRAGRSADALAVFRQVRRALDHELGVGPGADLVALDQAIRRDDPTLGAPPPVSLPSPPGRFVGRERELAETADRLGRTSLLTLVGPGGCGKTRLALELARRALPAHPDGVRFVDLAPLEPADDVAAAVLAELDLREQGEGTAADALAAQLRGRRMLLVLDNCERVAEPCAELVGRLLAMCVSLRVLVTTRQPLGLPGEVVWRVPGLGGPDAIGLLADRASAALPGRGLDSVDADVAAAICRRVDGLPLAIELVAARLPSTSLGEIASNLDRRLALLVTTGPGRPPRHRTMREAIAWSHALLDAEERALFRRLSVFAGTFELAAAEKVGADSDSEAPTRPEDVMPALFRLTDKSMVSAESSFAGRTRYRLLDTIREYAAEQLVDSAEAERTRLRHARWYGRLVRSLMGWGAVDDDVWPYRLGAEMRNLRAAVDWCLRDGREPDRALGIVAPLWPYFWVLGKADEGRRWLLRCLAAAGPEPTRARGMALRAAAHLTRHCGDLDEARRLGEECLATFRALDDIDGIPAALNGLGITALARGDYDSALGYLRAGLDELQRKDVPAARAATLDNLGAALRCVGRLDEASETLHAALEVSRGASDRRTEGATLNDLSLVAARRGDVGAAVRWGRESLGVYTTLRFAEGQLDALETLAALEVAAGRPYDALQMLTVVERERRQLGGAALGLERRKQLESALTAARSALSEERRAAALGEARLIGRADLISRLLT
jgi:predicted ATPase/DNA-binding SARP family transcriptional activator